MKKVISVLVVLGFVSMLAIPSLIAQTQEKEFNYDEWEKKPGNVRVTRGMACLSGDGEYQYMMLAFANYITEIEYTKGPTSRITDTPSKKKPTRKLKRNLQVKVKNVKRSSKKTTLGNKLR